MSKAPREVSEKVRRFVSSNIDSVELLRILLLLHSDPDREWTLTEINQELRSAESSIRIRLNDLYSRKLLEPGTVSEKDKKERHCLRYSSVEVREMVSELADLQKSRPYTLIDLIYSNRPNSNDALREFSDAFKIKKED